MAVTLFYSKLLEIAQNAIAELEFSEYEHEAILEYLNISEEEYRVIKGVEEKIGGLYG